MRFGSRASLLRNLHKSGDFLGVFAARATTPRRSRHRLPTAAPCAIASATFSGVSPPARTTGTPGSKPARSSQGARWPVPPSCPST